MNKVHAPQVNPVKSTKPSIPTSASTLNGYIAGSMNAGHNRTIKCIPIMAGQKIYQYAPMLRISLLTPKTPAYQKLKGKLSLFFVPNSRVMKDWENFEAQIKNETETTIKEEPNFGGKRIPTVLQNEQNNHVTLLMNTTAWRDCWLASYIPRVGRFIADNGTNAKEFKMPKYSALPARGMIAIYNDFLRNKEYDEKITEYNGNTVSDVEWNSYLPNEYGLKSDTSNMRARRSENYFTDYRTQYQGFNEDHADAQEAPDLTNLNNNLVTWASWEAKIAEARSQAESANDNAWERIAEIRGSQTAYQGKVQKISEKIFDINYSAITQNAYNANQNIEEQFQVMGKQGAYSYTEIMVPLLAGWEAIESGHLHVIFNVYSENAFENGFERQWLNVNALDKYRPDLKDDKLDVLWAIESDGNANQTETTGFKRKFNEYFKLPNCIFGDATNNNYFQLLNDNGEYTNNGQVITQKTYTFFEQDRESYQKPNGYVVYKKIWKDYSDLMLNKNQAILNDIYQESTEEGIIIQGQHQIFFVGEDYMACELPIDSAIAENYTKYGEH